MALVLIFFRAVNAVSLVCARNGAVRRNGNYIELVNLGVELFRFRQSRTGHAG